MSTSPLPNSSDGKSNRHKAHGPVTVMQLARAAGVSLPTASFALNDHPRVSARTRQRVAEAAQRLGYVPNYAARRLARSRADSRSTNFGQIGFMYVTDHAVALDAACIAMMQGAEEQLADADACLLFVRVDKTGWDKVNRLAQSGVVDAWLISGQATDDALDRLKAMGIPHVAMGDHLCTKPVHTVTVDHFGAGRIAAHHLVDLGHRRIGFQGGTFEFNYQTLTLEGFRAGLREREVDYDERLIVRKALKQWLGELSEPPTAIFAAEPAGNSVRQILTDSGLDVPRQVSVIGCEFAQSPTIVKDLSRIELPFDEVGRQAARLLQRVVAEPYLGSNELKLFATLIDRGSTQSPEP